MNQFMKSPSDPSRTEGRSMRLAERELPPRVRRLLDGLVERTAWFEAPLGQLLDEVEQSLFKQADRARSNEQQTRMMEAIRELKRRRGDVVPRFLAHLESVIARFDHSDANAKPETRVGGPRGGMKLELVESADLELSLAIQDIASKAEIRHSQALHELGHRFGVIAGKPAFELEQVPLGPLSLAEAVRHAQVEFDLGTNERVLIFQVFDRTVMTAIGTFYDIVNGYLAEQRVLPHLQYRVRRGGSGSDGGADNADDTPESEGAGPTEPTPEQAANAAAAAARGAAPPTGAGMSRAAMPMPGMPGAAQTGMPMPPGMPAQAGMRAAAAAPPAMAGADSADSNLFSSLRSLLADRRNALGMTEPPPGSTYLATRDDLQSVLSSLQAHPAGPAGGKSAPPRDIGHLKQDLLKRLRERSPQGQTASLALEDSDTIDLVGMLFDYIGQNLSGRSATRDLMSKLQVPVLRTALGDKNFFSQRNHPARLLLNSIAEASVLWLDDDDPDRGFVDKMTALVDRVSHEFDGNLSLIEDMLGDLSRHMAQLGKRAEMAERRHVDAAKGREKLELARERATMAVSRLLKRRTPAPAVRTVLERAWADVLALTILRQGEDSPNYRRRLAVADQLMRIGDEDAATGKPAPINATLRDEVRTGLTQVGLHTDEVENIVGELFEPQKETAEASEAEVAQALKSKPRLGGETGASDEPAKPTSPLNAEEQRMLEHIRTLPFGTWFDFVTNQQGASVRRKLAWFSTFTGRCLFVNQRGARTDERSMEQLAKDLVSGQVRLHKPEPTNFIDRAWQAIMAKLRGLTGDSHAPAAATT